MPPQTTPAPAATNIGDPVTLNERSRVYRFPAGNVALENVVELVVRPSGTHRIKTADGQLHIISPHWLAVSIIDESNDWTV